MTKRKRYSPEVREPAVRPVQEPEPKHGSERVPIESIAAKIRRSAETLRRWVWRVGPDNGLWPGLTTEEHQRLEGLERENRELRHPNERLPKAPAHHAQSEFDLRGQRQSQDQVESSTRECLVRNNRRRLPEPIRHTCRTRDAADSYCLHDPDCCWLHSRNEFPGKSGAAHLHTLGST